MRILLIVSGLLTLTSLAAGCADAAPEDDVAASEGELRAPSTIIESDNGKAFTVTKGDDVKVLLWSNPAAGYEWKVVSTPRELGYPSPRDGQYQAPAGGGPIGGGGKQLFTWKTTSPLLQPSPDAHAIKLEYRRPFDAEGTPAARTFTFDLTVLPPASIAPPPAPPITLYPWNDGATFTAVVGQDVAVRLPQSGSTGFAWVVESVDRTFGQPAKSLEPPAPGAPAGSSGTAVFTWKTDGPLGMRGSHTVTLKTIGGASEAAAQHFSFTVLIVEARR